MNKKSYKKPKAMDIFCGCGGTTQGLKDAGFSVIAGVENDPLAVATFRANHKRVKVWSDDIRKLEPVQLLKHHSLEKGDLDLLAGCPPCQAFSSMRRLNGKCCINDPDSQNLIFEFLKFVEGLLPKVILLENVPHLIEDYRFSEVRERLRQLGYTGQPAIFNATDFGVPQRRRRMIYIASRIGKIEYAAKIGSSERLTVRDVIGNLPEPGNTGDVLHDIPEKRSEEIVEIIAMVPKDGGSRRALGEEWQLKCHKKIRGFKDVYGRMAWDDVSPTITGGCVNPSKGRFLHPDQNRAITLREAALLQSFPKDYYFSLDRGKYAAGLMIGNAFPPQFVKPHATKIFRHIKNGTANRSKTT